ncbi:hypothetical protein SteCoe_178 [Stentor coeruleus]|uniref:Uncharacterized protein n=1 Tax=Stentor coeruleus TaxID=5963 RepID=A0A1R2D4N1_9CILI|nr:hypothetical protein SteCoe_178 [Stentor coeruleus]
MLSRKKDSYNIIILGDPGVGKTSIFTQFINKQFNPQYNRSFDLNFEVKNITIHNETLTLKIWDTSSYEMIGNNGSNIFLKADCCILVYDITNIDSFNVLSIWKNMFLMKFIPRTMSNFPFIVLGNKVDYIKIRTVDTLQALTWCKTNGDMSFYEVSAKENINLENAFQDAAKKAILYQKDEENYKSGINLRPSDFKSSNCYG